MIKDDLSTETDPESWASSLIGRMWEIYWEPSASNLVQKTVLGEKKPSKRKREDDDEDTNAFEPDWYDGTIISKDQEFFHVVFLGEDDKVYRMKLQCNAVRPSARAWIQDAVRLLLDPFPELRHHKGKNPLISLNSAPVDNCVISWNSWKEQLQRHLVTLKQLSVHDSMTDEDNEDKCNDRRKSLGTPGSQNNLIFSERQLEDEQLLLQDGLPLDTSPHQDYLEHLAQNLRFARHVCNWWDGEASSFLQEKRYFSDLSVFINRGIVCIVGWICLRVTVSPISADEEILFTSFAPEMNGETLGSFAACHTSKKCQDPYRPKRPRGDRPSHPSLFQQGFIEQLLQWLDDSRNGGKVDHFTILYNRRDLRLFLQNIISLPSSYPFRLFLPYLASKILHVLENLWEPAFIWIEESNRLLGSILRPMDCGNKDRLTEMDEHLEAQLFSRYNKTSMKSAFTIEDLRTHIDISSTESCFQSIQLDPYNVALREKMDFVRNVQAQLWHLIEKCTDEPSDILSVPFLSYKSSCFSLRDDNDDRPWRSVEDVDSVLRDLCKIQTRWNSDPQLSNMSSSESLSPQILEQVIFIRRWIIDMKLVESRRERHGLVTSVMARGSSIPHLPNVPVSVSSSHSSSSNQLSSAEVISTMLGRLASLSSHLYSSGIIASNYERWFQESKSDSFPSGCSEESINLRSIPGLYQALENLEKFPIVYPVEEYLIIRLHVLQFYSWVEPQLSVPNKRFSFQDISYMHSCSQSLYLHKHINIATGQPSKERSPCLLYDESSERKLMDISNSEMTIFCAEISKTLTDMFDHASAWKSHATTLIGSLRELRATSNTTRNKNLVHFHSIEELIRMYDNGRFLFEDDYIVLRTEQKHVRSWMTEINDVVRNYNRAPFDLSVLRAKNEQRPIGILTNPTTEAVLSWIDFLVWYQRISEELPSPLENSDRHEFYLNLIRDQLGRLLWEGYEILVDVLVVENMSLFYKVIPSHMFVLVRGNLNAYKIRGLSAASLKSTETGLYLLKSLSTIYDSGRCKVFLFQLLLWHLAAVQCLHNINTRQPSDSQRPSLLIVKTLLDCVSSSSTTWNIHMLANMFDIALYIRQTTFRGLNEFVDRSTRLENDVEKAVAECDNFQGNIFQNSTSFVNLSRKLSLLGSNILSPSVLQLSAEIQLRLNKRLNEFVWLENCLKFPVLDNSPEKTTPPSTQPVEGDILDDGLGHVDDFRIPILVLHDLHHSFVSLKYEKNQHALRGIDNEISRLGSIVSKLVYDSVNWKNDVKMQCRPGIITNLSQLESLNNNNLLNQVVIVPEEDILSSMLDHGVKIRMALNLFFTRSNLNEQLEVVLRSPPRTCSLVGKSGEFILFQFYGSTLYSQLKEYFDQYVHSNERMTINTSDQYLLRWLSDLMRWADALGGKFHHSSSHKLTIGYDDCNESIAVGSKLLLSIPTDVLSSLASYYIGLVVKQPSGRLSLSVTDPVVSCSVGSYALRWFLFLFNALKADSMTTEGWHISLEKYTTLFLSSNTSQKRKDSLKKIRDLVGEVNEKIVVMPLAVKLSEAVAIINSEELDTSYASFKHSIADFADRFEHEEEIVHNRYEILDNLLSRKAISRVEKIFELSWDHILQHGGVVYESSILSSNDLIRLKTRSLLESSFSKAIENIGIQKSCKIWNDTISFCSFLGWELETIVYDKFVGETSEDCERQINDDYKAKVRSLRFNLEDKKNPFLCAKVLLGFLSPSSLVEMTPEQLANKNIQEVRSKAEEESNNSIIIQAIAESTFPSFDHRFIKETNPILTVPVVEKTSTKLENMPFSPSPTVTESYYERSTDNGITCGAQYVESSTSPLMLDFPSRPSIENNLLIIDSSSSDNDGNLLLTTDEDDGLESKIPSSGRSGFLVMSRSGMNEFLFTIKAMKLSFSAGLLWEKTLPIPFSNVTNILPDSFVDKGRVPIDEFNNFVSGKMKSNRWEVIPLKIVNIHDGDVANFKTFYKEYESIRRLAMFRVSDDLHLFLVTPKFIDVAQCLKETVNRRLSTYAVLLKRYA